MSSAQKHSSRLIAVNMAMAALLFLYLIHRLCVGDSDIYFLERHAPAEWVLYPKPSQCLPQGDSEFTATFRRDFVLRDSATAARLSIRALTKWSLAVNGFAVAESTPGKNWKQATELDISRQLHSGTNEILVSVFNSNGPPVLWLALEAGATQIVSGPDWDVSLMGAVPVKAAIASAPVQFGKGSPLSGAESPLPSLLKCLPLLAIFGVLSAALVVGGGHWLKRYRELGEPRGPLTSPKFAAIAAAIPVILCVALFFNNYRFLVPRAGYDSSAHLDYIHYISNHWRLPLATDGWQMYQPPLYYLICAVLLLPFGPETLAAVRLFDFGIGAAHLIIVFLCLRLLFPGRPGLQWFGLLLAAFLPAILVLSQFITNESFAATLFSAAVYFCLRILKEDSNSPPLFLGFGLCLGASLLSKFTGIIGLPFFAIALLSRPALNARFPSRIRAANILIGFALAFAICGWHYFRVWRHFGSPVVGNWDAVSGHNWWMDEGCHTRAWFFHFGSSLVYPWFSGINGFADGLYSTLWGDGMWSGNTNALIRPPWNYNLMAAGYLLALLPTCLILAGAVIALRRFIRQPDPVWFLLLGVAFSMLAALIYMSVKLPSYAQVKAFYGLIAVVPVCALATLGWDFLLRQGKLVFLIAATLMGVWAINAYASFWIRSSNPAAHLVLGRYLESSGNSTGALQEITEAARLAPNNPEVRTRLAVLLSVQNPVERNRLLQLNLKEFPDDAETHAVTSLLFAAHKPFEPAIAEAEKAIALGPDDPLAYAPLCKFFISAGHYREAAEAGRDGLRVTPYNPELQYLTGQAFVAAGDPTNASRHFAHAVSLDPNNATYHHRLALALAAIGKTSDAVNECRRALELDSNFSAARDTLKSLEAKRVQP